MLAAPTAGRHPRSPPPELPRVFTPPQAATAPATAKATIERIPTKRLTPRRYHAVLASFGEPPRPSRPRSARASSVGGLRLGQLRVHHGRGLGGVPDLLRQGRRPAHARGGVLAPLH